MLSISFSFSAVGLALLLIVLIPVIRFLSISLLPLLFKVSGKSFPLARTERKLFWYTGLIRGIIAFALSLQIESENAPFLRTVSMIIVMATTIAGSTLLNHFSRWIGLGDLELMTVGEEKKEERENDTSPSTKYGAIGLPEEMREME